MTTDTQRASRQFGRAGGQAGDDLVGVSESSGRCQRGRVGEMEVVGGGGAKLQIQAGVVAEGQRAGRQVDLALQRARRRRGARNRLEHPKGYVAGGRQTGPGVALVVGDAGQRGETRPSGGQIGRPLTLVDNDAERAAAGGEPADDVLVNPRVHSRICGLSCEHAGVTAFHSRVFSMYVASPNLTA